MAYGIRKLIVNRSAVIVKREAITESSDNHTMTHRNHPISSPAEALVIIRHSSGAPE